VYIVGTALSYVCLGLALVLILRDIFVYDEHLTKFQMVVSYWPLFVASLVTGVVGGVAKPDAKTESDGEDGVREEPAS